MVSRYDEGAERPRRDFCMLMVDGEKKDGPESTYELKFETTNFELLQLVYNACSAVLSAFKLSRK